MTKKTTTLYGSWKSPITADLIISDSIGFGQTAINGYDMYWLEKRPQEKGRGVIVKQDSKDNVEEVNPKKYNVRTRVHEYGGGDYLVHDGDVYFSNFNDQQIYKFTNGTTKQLSHEKDMLFADGVFDTKRNRIIYIQEDRRKKDKEAINSIISMDADTGECSELVAGNDFYSSPKISPNSSKLAWLTWNHPNMPWDGTELWTAHINDNGELSNRQQVAGGENESIFQPEWSPDGVLYFISDKNNWWNLYRYLDSIESVFDIDAELGMPQWSFGQSTYGFISKNECLCFYSKEGKLHLVNINIDSKKVKEIPTPFDIISRELRVSDGKAMIHAGYTGKPSEIVLFDYESQTFTTIKQSSNITIDSGYISHARSITFPTTYGGKAYAYYYPPTNKDYEASDDELPPLLVKCHGGPTASTSSSFNLGIQYWTSRGFGVVDVDYRGSTGYGRKYRDALKKQWGILDIDDAIYATTYLIDKGLVDKERLAISGGSAGGYTVLAALTFHDHFSAGASYYGIGDLELLTNDIHKFESKYLDSLIGPYPESKQVYYDRSPIHFIEKLSSPVIFLQGLEDLIVPPNQAQIMVEALNKRGVPAAYLAFEGEQHGFRQGKNIKKALESELYFYGKIFGFTPADNIEPLEIKNL